MNYLREADEMRSAHLLHEWDQVDTRDIKLCDEMIQRAEVHLRRSSNQLTYYIDYLRTVHNICEVRRLTHGNLELQWLSAKD
jgi:hypothetical protein